MIAQGTHILWMTENHLHGEENSFMMAQKVQNAVQDVGVRIFFVDY